MIRALLLSALLAGCATHHGTPEPALAQQPTLPLQDVTGHRMEALNVSGERACTADGVWCVVSEPGSAWAEHNGARVGRMMQREDDAVWPVIVRYPSDTRALIGIAHTEEQSYSGGGAHATSLALYALPAAANGEAVIVLNAPLEGAAFIRACFSEEEYRDRRMACADEYDFSASLALDTHNETDAPRFIFTTEASTFPGQRSRYEDSTLGPPLRERDLVRWRDDTCSYTRTFSFDATNNVYVSNEDLPLCGDYLQP